MIKIKGITIEFLPKNKSNNYFFQSKLNCEVLSNSIGLQLRWSVAQENIILQIVGNLGMS